MRRQIRKLQLLIIRHSLLVITRCRVWLSCRVLATCAENRLVINSHLRGNPVSTVSLESELLSPSQACGIHFQQNKKVLGSHFYGCVKCALLNKTFPSFTIQLHVMKSSMLLIKHFFVLMSAGRFLPLWPPAPQLVYE